MGVFIMVPETGSKKSRPMLIVIIMPLYVLWQSFEPVHSPDWTQPLLTSSSLAARISGGHTYPLPQFKALWRQPYTYTSRELLQSITSMMAFLRCSLVKSILQLLARGSTASRTSPKSSPISNNSYQHLFLSTLSVSYPKDLHQLFLAASLHYMKSIET